MAHARALLWKSLVNGIPLLLILRWIGPLPWAESIAIVVGLTLFAYLLGDLLLLPLYGNGVATLADGGLTLVVVWGLRGFGIPVSATAAIVAAAAIMLIEAYHYHGYVNETLTTGSVGE